MKEIITEVSLELTPKVSITIGIYEIFMVNFFFPLFFKSSFADMG